MFQVEVGTMHQCTKHIDLGIEILLWAGSRKDCPLCELVGEVESQKFEVSRLETRAHLDSQRKRS